MNNWKELLDSFGTVGFITTATTGLSYSFDRLIAVSYIILGTGGRTEGRLMQLVDKDDLDKSSDYHGISVSRQLAEAVEPAEFQEQLARLLDGVNWFTYNPQFQGAFLAQSLDFPVVLHDLPRILRFVDSGSLPGDQVSLKDIDADAARLIGGKSVPYKSTCTARGLDPTVPIGTLPCVHACRNLERLYCSLSQTPLVR